MMRDDRLSLTNGTLGAIPAFKILRLEEGKYLGALYHGVNGSRRLPRQFWIRAEKKWVRESAGPLYWSGFHVLPSRRLAKKYMKKFQDLPGRKLVIREVRVRGDIRRKNPRSPVLLVDEMLVL